MLRNKIYNHISYEFFRTFFIILFAFTVIAWTVRAVYYLHLIVDDAYSIKTYAIYSILNLSNIITKFIPVSFLFSLILTIYQFKNKKEFLILWCSGINKLSIVNLFTLISIIIIILNLLLSIIITPNSLNYSRTLLKSSDLNQVSAVIKQNDFTDTFQNITFFVDEKIDNYKFKNIFIRDETNSISGLINDKDSKDKTIIAKNGYVENNKLILSDGIIHSSNGKEISSLKFKKTEITLNSLNNRTIQQPKLRETKTSTLYNCLFFKNDNLLNCPISKLKTEVLEHFSRRVSMPFYILMISLICCFALFSNEEKENNSFKRYFVFIFSFITIIFSEILIRYTGKSELFAINYFLVPMLFSPILYCLLIYKSQKEKLLKVK